MKNIFNNKCFWTHFFTVLLQDVPFSFEYEFLGSSWKTNLDIKDTELSPVAFPLLCLYSYSNSLKQGLSFLCPSYVGYFCSHIPSSWCSALLVSRVLLYYYKDSSQLIPPYSLQHQTHQMHQTHLFFYLFSLCCIYCMLVGVFPFSYSIFHKCFLYNIWCIQSWLFYRFFPAHTFSYRYIP